MAPRMKVEVDPQPSTNQAASANASKGASAASRANAGKSAATAPQTQSLPKTSAPKARVSPKVTPKVESAPAQDPPRANVGSSASPEQDFPQSAAEPDREGRFAGARVAAAGWVHRTFPGHENAFWGGIIALVVALLVFIIGLWRVLLICVLVVIGVAVGQVLDGDPKIIRMVGGLVKGDREQR